MSDNSISLPRSIRSKEDYETWSRGEPIKCTLHVLGLLVAELRGSVADIRDVYQRITVGSQGTAHLGAQQCIG
jgi:hypothetical protein